MYNPALDMSISDFAVSRAIKELSEIHETFNITDIADYIPCDRVTAWRSLNRLLSVGTVVRSGRKGRYRYIFIEDMRLKVKNA